MKQGWTIETISSLCEQMNGIWKGEKEPLTTAKILRTTNFSKDCQMKLDDLAIIEVEQKKMEKRRLKKGDIIVEKSGGGPKQPVGRVILFNIDDDDFSFCNFTSALRIKDQTKILPEFLHKYLTYLYFSGETEKYQSNLVGFRNLDFKGYVSICVKYPSLSEQQRIVTLLDAEFAKIDTLKANAERNMQNAKDLFRAALKKELEPKEGWKSMLLGDFAKMKAGDFIKASDIHSDYYEGSFPCYGGNGLRGYVDVPNKEGEYCLIGRQGALCGNVHIANGVFRATEHAVVVEPYFSMPIKLVYYLLTALNLNKYSTGAAQPGLSVKNIAEKAMISIPPEEKYSIIAATLDGLSVRTQALQANYEKTLSLCDDLKQALLRKAFNGEI